MRKTLISLAGIFLILFSAGAVAYFPALPGTFILDDYVWIQPLSMSEISHLFVGSWEHGNTLRPIMRLQFLSSLILFGENPLYWHLTNIMLHAFIGTACFSFLHAITKQKHIALGTALLFTIFPANHEVVAWISGRTHSFGLLLSLASGYLLYRSFFASRYQYAQMLGGYALFLAALLTYEVAFAVPIGLFAAIVLLKKIRWRSFLICTASLLILAALVYYRIRILGSVGSTNQHYDNIFLAPFLNLRGIRDLFWYSKELKIAIVLLGALLGTAMLKKRIWQAREFSQILLFFSLTIISYLPFAIVHGVAPRFLYSSFFFFCIGMGLVFHAVWQRIQLPVLRYSATALVIFILIASAGRTWQVSVRYKEVAHAFSLIPAQIKEDIPVWPKGKNLLLYDMPNSNNNVLAFLTYTDKAIARAYGTQPIGVVYRAERLTDEELSEVLRRDPFIYRFVGFNAGVIRVNQ